MRRISTLLAIGLLAVGVGCAGDTSSSPDEDGGTTAPATTEPATGGEETDASVSLTEFEFTPSAIEVSDGDTVSVTNDGAVEHSFTVEELDVDLLLKAGEDGTVTISGEPGTYELICTVAGHVESGMVGELTIG